jgi:hypothetical protein
MLVFIIFTMKSLDRRTEFAEGGNSVLRPRNLVRSCDATIIREPHASTWLSTSSVRAHPRPDHRGSGDVVGKGCQHFVVGTGVVRNV